MAVSESRFEEYWAEFVRAHAAPSMRRLIVAAMTAGLGAAVAGILGRRPLLLALAPLIAFGPPAFARRLEGTALARAPLFCALASLRMWHLTVTRAMDAEAERVKTQVPVEPRDDPGADAPFPRPNMVTDHTLH